MYLRVEFLGATLSPLFTAMLAVTILLAILASRGVQFSTDGKLLFFTIASDEADVSVMTLKRP